SPAACPPRTAPSSRPTSRSSRSAPRSERPLVGQAALLAYLAKRQAGSLPYDRQRAAADLSGCSRGPVLLSSLSSRAARRTGTEVCTMRTCRTLLALLLFVPAGLPAEIQPLKGEPIKGDVVSVSDKEVVYLQDGKKVTRPIKEVLKIDFRDVGKLSGAEKYSLVELTDGTQLLASKVLIKKKEFELKLLAGPEVKLPAQV